MTAYQHQPLTGPRSIRVLRLLPQRTDGQVRVELAEVSLDDDNVEYEALSYVWGEDSQNPREQILYEGKTLLVTQNCMAALLQLRTTDVRTLWVDAICIDQTSLSERSHQVQLMGEIYSRARRVVVWLGEGSRESDTALAWLSVVAQEGGATQQPFQARVQAVTTQLAAMDVVKRMRLLLSVSEVLGRSWFNRMWTLQELALARAAWMQCGKLGMSWEELCLGACISAEAIPNLESLTVYGDVLRAPIALHHHIRSSVEAKREGKPTAKNMTFNDLLASTVRHASEPRDKVYSLYGLCRLFGMAVPEPDYSMPVKLVYIEVTQAAVLHDKSLILLHQVGTRSKDERLPSWVPNWNSDAVMNRLLPDHFMATGSSAPSFSISQDGWRLTVSGVLVDEIDERAGLVLPTRGRGSERRLMIFESIRVIQQWRALAAKRFPEPYKTGQTVHEAFFRTVMRDGSVGRDRDVEKYREPFRQWYKAFANADVAQIQAKCHGKGDAQILRTLGVEDRGIFLHPRMESLIMGQAFCSTAVGYMAMAPDWAQVGDLVVLLMGVPAPFVIRREGDAYRLIGSVYVHGIMDGEFFAGEHPAVSDFTFI